MAGAVSNNGNTYSRLYDYKFLDNKKFLEGWKKISDIVPENQLLNSYIKVQVYFYSREVEPVDLDGYKVWLEENNKSLELPDLRFVQENTESTNPAEDNTTAQDSQSDKLEDSVEMSAGRHPINFVELIAMVHNGIPLPGTEDLNIEPTNENPTSSIMQRPKKPWEICVE